ncbi:MAG: DUF5063 domain-containing protein [Marinifilaceae bacterium]
MEEGFEHVAYSRNVIEFVTVANEFCATLEACEKSTRKDFIEKAQKMLPLLYLKGTLLPEVENELEDTIEKFVTEADWEFIRTQVQRKLGPVDEYLEVFQEEMRESDSPIVASISENFADIYQDLKDFLTSYRIGTLEIMNDALWELKGSFDRYWGQLAVNALRAVHNVLSAGIDLIESEADQSSPSLEDIDLSDSIFSQRKREWGENM